MSKRADTMQSGYGWSFTRIGGVDQVVLRNGEDIAHIPYLDQKLWAALAMPKKGDGVLSETLDLLDADNDGRIRAPDICAAIDFASAGLVSLDDFFSAGESIKVSNLKTDALKEAAQKVLQMASKESTLRAQEVSLSDTAVALERFAQENLNGDGVVSPEDVQAITGSEALTLAVKAILDAGHGAAGHDAGSYARLGVNDKHGLDKDQYERFIADAKAWLEWNAKGDNATVKPLGEGTDAAWSAFAAVKDKIDDWFLRSRLVLLTGKGQEALGEEERFKALFAGKIELNSPELLALPIATPQASLVLDLESPGLNPGWAGALETFRNAIAPLLVAGTLGASDWERIKAVLAPYGAWLAEKPAGKAGSLGKQKLTEILGTPEIATLPALIQEDASKAALRDKMLDVRKLILLRRDLMRILRNFVNFSDFYLGRDGIFQAGHLFLDGRECELCIDVENPNAHALLASMSNVYLAYCDCTRKDGSRKTIVAGFTAGDADNLFVGRNGVFYDKDGLDWDAHIVRIVAQPISIREAFFSPYKLVARSIENMVQRRASSAEASTQTKLNNQAENAIAAAVGEKKPEGAQTGGVQASPLGTAGAGAGGGRAGTLSSTPGGSSNASRRIDVGTVAAIGVALGSIGTMITNLLVGFVGMGAWLPVGIVVIILLISGPSMLLAYLKLRKRNLGPILDAEGWAVNGRLKINVPFGGALTHLGTLPAGVERKLMDPFAEKRRPWGLYAVLAVIVAVALLWIFGAMDSILPISIQFGTIIGR